MNIFAWVKSLFRKRFTPDEIWAIYFEERERFNQAEREKLKEISGDKADDLNQSKYDQSSLPKTDKEGAT